MNAGLHDALDEAGFRARIAQSTALLQALAQEIADRAVAQHALLDTGALRAAIGDRPAADDGAGGFDGARLFGALPA